MSYEAIYQELFGDVPPKTVTFTESSSAILRAGRGFVDEFDFTLQTQVGCPGGCLFCYVPSSTRLTPVALHGGRWGFEVRRKRQVVNKWAAHLCSGELADKTIYWSGVTDPYAAQPAETRAMWQVLCDVPAHLRPRRVVVQSRYRPDRDVELLARYNQSTQPSDGGPAVVVSYSIGTDRNDLIREWERATPLFEQRLKTIETLRAAGIWVVPTLSPFGLWNDLEGTLCQFQAWGVPYITCLFFKVATESANTPSDFIGYVRREYPMLLDRQWQWEQLGILRSVFGEAGVIVGKAGFASLTAPQRVGPTATRVPDLA